MNHEEKALRARRLKPQLHQNLNVFKVCLVKHGLKLLPS